MQISAIERPNAVLYIASEMPSASFFWRSAGLASPIDANVWIRPVIVPSRPTSVQMLASDHSAPIRVFTSGSVSVIVSSIACATAASPRCSRLSPALATRATGAVVASHSFLARSTLFADSSLRSCSRNALALRWPRPRK